MTTEMKVLEYPAWQAKIREAQVEARRLEAEKEAKRAEERLEKAKQNAQKMRELLANLGLEMPESITLPSWEIDGYRFELTKNNNVMIYKPVPGADPLLEDEYHYVLEVSLSLSRFTLSGLADILDELDELALNRAQRNSDYIKRRKAVDNDTDKYKQVALTLTPSEVNLINALRAFIEDSQSSSDSDW